MRFAASVILHRRGARGEEVYLVERNPNVRFFPAYHAFPGGTLTREEVDAAGTDTDAAFARAALRELEEEVGVRCSRADLTPAGRLNTPEFVPVRYDTRFYLARLPEGQHARIVDTRELVDGAWWRPADALDAWARGELLVPPPTIAFLRKMTAHATFADAAAAVETENHLPHHTRFFIEMHPDVIALPQRTPTLPPATSVVTYFVRAENDLVVVDPGTPHEEEQAVLADHVERLLEHRQPRAIVLTHHHADHVAAAGFLKARFGFRVLAHADAAALLPDGLVDALVADGDAIDLGTHAASGRAWRLEVVHTPGHAPGHVVLRDSRFGALFAGDLVSGVSTIHVDPEEGDMAAYLASLERAIALDPPLVLPAHGPPLPGTRVLKETLAHRSARTDRVREALGKSPGAPLEDVARDAYADTPHALPVLAASQTLSILRMMEKRGEAREERERWWLESARGDA